MSNSWKWGAAPPQAPDYTAANQLDAQRQAFNAKTFAPAANYYQGVLSGKEPSAADLAGQQQTGLLNAANFAANSSGRGGLGGANASRAAMAGNTAGQSALAGQVGAGMGAERTGAATGLGNLGYTYGQNQLQEQALQQKQVMDPMQLELAKHSQDLEQSQIDTNNTRQAVAGVAGLMQGGAMMSDERKKEDTVSQNVDWTGWSYPKLRPDWEQNQAEDRAKTGPSIADNSYQATRDFYGTDDPEKLAAREDASIDSKTGFGRMGYTKPTGSIDPWDSANALFKQQTGEEPHSDIAKWTAPDESGSTGGAAYPDEWNDMKNTPGRNGQMYGSTASDETGGKAGSGKYGGFGNLAGSMSKPTDSVVGNDDWQKYASYQAITSDIRAKDGVYSDSDMKNNLHGSRFDPEIASRFSYNSDERKKDYISKLDDANPVGSSPWSDANKKDGIEPAGFDFGPAPTESEEMLARMNRDPNAGYSNYFGGYGTEGVSGQGGLSSGAVSDIIERNRAKELKEEIERSRQLEASQKLRSIWNVPKEEAPQTQDKGWDYLSKYADSMYQGLAPPLQLKAPLGHGETVIVNHKPVYKYEGLQRKEDNPKELEPIPGRGSTKLDYAATPTTRVVPASDEVAAPPPAEKPDMIVSDANRKEDPSHFGDGSAHARRAFSEVGAEAGHEPMANSQPYHTPMKETPTHTGHALTMQDVSQIHGGDGTVQRIMPNDQVVEDSPGHHPSMVISDITTKQQIRPESQENPETSAMGADIGGITSDKMSKEKIKKASPDSGGAENKTNTGDAGGKEQAEAKRGDKESERKEHNSQHTPSRKSETKEAEKPTQKERLDLYGAKQPVDGRGRAWYDEYFKKDAKIPEGNAGYDGRVGMDNRLGNPSSVYDDAFSLKSDDQLKAAAIKQDAFTAGRTAGAQAAFDMFQRQMAKPPAPSSPPPEYPPPSGGVPPMARVPQMNARQWPEQFSDPGYSSKLLSPHGVLEREENGEVNRYTRGPSIESRYEDGAPEDIYSPDSGGVMRPEKPVGLAAASPSPPNSAAMKALEKKRRERGQ